MKIIKHLVLSGGGPTGLIEYGAIKYLTNNNIINHNTIESIYATSIGSIVAFIYILNFDWTWIDDFFIKRPWEKLVNISYSAYLNIFYDKGIVNKKIIINALRPLFLAKEIPLTKQLQTFLFGNTIVKKKKQIINFNLTNDSVENTTEASIKRSGSSPNMQACLNNCKNILWQLESELIK